MNEKSNLFIVTYSKTPSSSLFVRWTVAEESVTEISTLKKFFVDFEETKKNKFFFFDTFREFVLHSLKRKTMRKINQRRKKNSRPLICRGKGVLTLKRNLNLIKQNEKRFDLNLLEKLMIEKIFGRWTFISWLETSENEKIFE